LLKEQQRRSQARQSLLKYTEQTAIEDAPAAHHRVLIEALQKVEDGEIKQLMVFMPPGSAKSTYASVLFPSHYLGRFEGKKIIKATYEAGLATQFGRKVRNLTEQAEYRRIFPGAGLTADSKAKGEWELENGSSYYACGVGSGVTGRRGDGAIIDDPIKGRKEADSETVRNNCKDWWENDLTTRLKPEAWKVIIQTRWHEDDLAGWMLPEDWDGESGDIDCGDFGVWHVICIPAEARLHDPLDRKPGEWLWPEWFTPDFWEATRRQKSDRVWNSLYQQRPVADEGTFFKRENFWRFDPGKAFGRSYMTGDFAVTEPENDNDPDFTSLGVHKVSQDDSGEMRLWLCCDGWRGQRTVDDGEGGGWITNYFGLVKRNKPMCEFAEVGVIRRAIEGLLRRKRRETGARGRIEWVSHIGDKQANARALQDLAELGQVGIANTPMGDEVLNQLLKFPAGKHDDDVDMCALFARVVDEAHPLVKAVPPPKQKRDRWDKAFEEDEGESWRI